MQEAGSTARLRSAFAGAFISFFVVGAPCAADPASPADAAPPATATLTITVHHILDDAGGELLIGVYDEVGFSTPRSVPVAGKRTNARHSTTSVTFENLPPGTYAVKAFQDINGNGNFDVGTRGVEPFGFSNDPPVTVGLPPFDDAKFTVTAGTNSIELTLH